MSIETIRQALRDYSREEGACVIARREGETDFELHDAQRGELAGKAFVALQKVLTKLEDMAAEAEKAVTATDPHALCEERGRKQAQRREASSMAALIEEALR